MTDLPPAGSPYFDRERETMSHADLAELQLDLLLDTIAFTYDRSAIVRQRWRDAGVTPNDIRSIHDFREKAPFLDKEDVRRFRDEMGDPYGGLLCRPEEELTAIMSTSGTTGDPTLVPELWAGGFVGPPAIMYRDFWSMGVRPGDHVTLFLFTFRGPTYGFAQQLGAIPILLDYDVAELPRLLELSVELRPTALYNFGSTMIAATVDASERTGIDPADAFSSYKGVVSAGEPIGPRSRALAASWGVELFEHSSVGDVTACFECPAHDGMHVWEDTALIEGVDPLGTDHRDTSWVDGDRVRCELVATSLTNRVAPLVRFRSDDLVEIDRRPCTCGRTHARIHTIGRKGDEIVVDGRSVLPVDVWPAVEGVEACRLGLFQIIRASRRSDRLHLRVGYQSTPEAALGSLRDEVSASVEAAIGLRPDVELVPDEQLLRLGPPHKIPRVARS